MTISNEDVASMLSEGKVGIFPTDTAFGIGCRMDNVTSIERIYHIRNRPKEKALLVLASSIDMVKEYVDIDTVTQEKLERFWPGGLTAILKCKKDKVHSVVRADGDTLAIRIPNHKELLAIIQLVGVPIVAPSANYSGMATPTTFSQIDTSLFDKVDFVKDGVCTMEGVSTIVDATVTPWKIVRQGVVNI